MRLLIPCCCFTILVSCAAPPSGVIVGRWAQRSGRASTSRIEVTFNSDGTWESRLSGSVQSLRGTFKVRGDQLTQLLSEATIRGNTVPFHKTITRTIKWNSSDEIKLISPSEGTESLTRLK